MGIPKEVLDCTVVKDPEDPEGFRMKYTQMRGSQKKTYFCEAGINPYLFVRRKDKSQVLELLNRSKFQKSFKGVYDNGEFISYQQEPMVKVEMSGPYQVGKFRSYVEERDVLTEESDIPFIRRWFIDMGIRQPLMKDILYADIEIDGRKGFGNPDNPTQRILSIAAVGSDGDEYFFCNRDERYILSHFFNLIKNKYQVITGWNFSGKRDINGVPFDWPYIINRCKKIGFRREFIPIQQTDAYRSYVRFVDYQAIGESNELDEVGHRHLGIGKTGKYDADLAWDSLVNDPKHEWLQKYNMRDAVLVKKLDEELNITNPYLVAASKLPVFLRDLDKMTLVWEAMILDKCKNLNPRLVVPRKRRVQYGDVRGALTFLPIPGIHDAVLVLDYTGLYIAVMQLISISPEMVHRFQQHLINEEGFEPEVVRSSDFVSVPIVRKYVKFVQQQSDSPVYKDILVELGKTRMEQKEKRRQASESAGKDSFEYKYYDAAQKFTKELLVSGYGVQAQRSKGGDSGLARFYNALMANMITFVARDMQMWTKKYFEKRGWIVLYGDTDSVFIFKSGIDWLTLSVDAEKIAKDVTNDVQEWLCSRYKIDDVSFANLKAEKVFGDIVHGQGEQKKHYIGYIVWHEDLGVCNPIYEVKGAAQKRADGFELQKEVEHEVIELYREHRDDVRYHVDMYLKRLRRELLDGKFDEKLVLSKGMTKPVDEYSDNYHLRKIAENLQSQGRFRPGQKLHWVVTDISRGQVREPIQDISEIDDLRIYYGGYDYYFDRIEKVVNKWIPPTYQQTTLEMLSS